MRIALVLAALSLALPSACRAPAVETPIAFEREAAGQIGPVLEAKNLVARSAEEWRACCRGGAPALDAALDDFDWSKRMLIAVALGSRPSGGYSVEIVSVVAADSHWVVRARETRPAPGSLQTAMVTSPFDCVSTPRFDGSVVFSFE